jgi:hypothetical protein
MIEVYKLLQYTVNEKMLSNGTFGKKAIDLGVFWNDTPKRIDRDQKKDAVNVADLKVYAGAVCPWISDTLKPQFAS